MIQHLTLSKEVKETASALIAPSVPSTDLASTAVENLTSTCVAFIAFTSVTKRSSAANSNVTAIVFSTFSSPLVSVTTYSPAVVPAATFAVTPSSLTRPLTYACTAASLFAAVAYSPRETVTSPATTCLAAASTATRSSLDAFTAEKSVLIVL